MGLLHTTPPPPQDLGCYTYALEPVKLIDEVTKSRPAECDLTQEERSEEIRRLSGEKEVSLYRKIEISAIFECFFG